MKNFLKGVLDFFIHLIRRILFFTTQFIIYIACGIIYIVTYEPNTKKQVTMRKIKRIRRLTNFKLWIWKHFGWYFNFIHDSKYFEDLERKLGK